MTDFKTDDRVRICWPDYADLHGRTGTIAQLKNDPVGGDYYTVHLDEPLDDETEFVSVWPDCLDRLQNVSAGPVDNDPIIAVFPACGAVVVAIHDPATRVYDVHCSSTAEGCGRFYTVSYNPGTTDDTRAQMRNKAKNAAFVHATTCYAGTPGTDPDATDRG